MFFQHLKIWNVKVWPIWEVYVLRIYKRDTLRSQKKLRNSSKMNFPKNSSFFFWDAYESRHFILDMLLGCGVLETRESSYFACFMSEVCLRFVWGLSERKSQTNLRQTSDKSQTCTLGKNISVAPIWCDLPREVWEMSRIFRFFHHHHEIFILNDLRIVFVNFK